MTARRSGPTLVADVGGTWTRLGWLRPDGSAGPLERFSTDALRGAEPVTVLARRARAYAARHDLTPARFVVGVPFTPDPDRETALSSPNVPSLEGAPLRSGLEAALGVPVRLERDVDLLTLGEWRHGAVAGVATVFAMFVGTGVGACYLERGVPFRGGAGSAVELGHVPIRDEGRRCVCGNLDCLEAYACGHVLRELAERFERPVDGLFAAADAPDALARALDRFVGDLARALATAVNLFAPQAALVGGGIPAMEAFPRERFEARMRAHLRRPVPATTVEVAWARLGSVAALHGAAALPLTERTTS